VFRIGILDILTCLVYRKTNLRTRILPRELVELRIIGTNIFTEISLSWALKLKDPDRKRRFHYLGLRQGCGSIILNTDPDAAFPGDLDPDPEFEAQNAAFFKNNMKFKFSYIFVSCLTTRVSDPYPDPDPHRSALI
jgi:hypothetical protein